MYIHVNYLYGGGRILETDAQHIFICNSLMTQQGFGFSLQLSKISSAAPLDMDRYSGIWGKCEANIIIT